MRRANYDNLQLHNFNLPKDVDISADLIINSIQHCYDTLDSIDNNLLGSNIERFSKLVEKANLSSIIGNLLTNGLVKYNNGSYLLNKPHTFPDLIPQNNFLKGIEVKVALERNKPKGHLPKSGYYITYRYVLTDENGYYVQGKENRGDVVTIWEVKFGYLSEKDFEFSDSKFDSGKTSVIRSSAQNTMKLLYYDYKCSPYKNIYHGYN